MVVKRQAPRWRHYASLTARIAAAIGARTAPRGRCTRRHRILPRPYL